MRATLLFLLLSLFIDSSLPACFCGESERLIPPGVQTNIAERLNIPLRQLRIEPSRMRLSANFPLLPFHEILLESPLDDADAVDRAVQTLSDPSIRFETLLLNAALLIDQRFGSIPSYKWSEIPPTADNFLACVSTLSQAKNASALADWQSEAQQKFLALPAPLQEVLVNFLSSQAQSMEWMQVGRESIASVVPLNELKELVVKKEISPREIKIIEQLIENVDRKALFRASAIIASCLSSFLPIADALRSAALAQPVVISTPAGDLILAGTSDDIHAYNTPPLLLIECGGNDVYKGVYAQSNEELPCSIAVDLGGEDAYQSDSCEWGAVCALAGFAALLDLGAESDRFEGTTRCFGYSFCGVSILYDQGGNSTCNAESLAFGASEMGVSLLIDRAGDDARQADSESMGYGAIGGFGLLLDSQGADRYIAPATPVVAPSAQLPEQNFSASLGFGTGRFGPNLDGRSFPGGVGFLLDAQGNDVYQASVFALGAGYGYGIGILADLAGDDRYEAAWYALGAAAHQGCGVFIDRSGGDVYAVSHYMMGGAAADFSLGVFVDEKGDDTYQALNASLGYGLTNSFALFLDGEGDDRYAVANQVGAGVAANELSETLRGLWPTYGIFVDESGEDRYINLPKCRNGAQWMESQEKELRLQSLGFDLPSVATASPK